MIKKKVIPNQDFIGKKILITAGPTFENIDPVRFIGNRSTGKMGIALAKEFISRGAEVIIVLGPVNIETPSNAKVINVTSAEEMAQNVFSNSKNIDVFVMAAAVADYTPMEVSDVKIKKKENDLVLKLKRTTDIAKELGIRKKDGQLLVGFALETNTELENAKIKLKKKNFDLIVLNSLKDEGAGFGFDTNKVTILTSKDNKIKNFKLKSKDDVAIDIVNEIIPLFDII
jgi:phosphopantothenoylcysteine decarboxylase/phosphopantothenate--cysteine ligase